MASALENYKSDHGNYPSDPKTTEQLRASKSFNPDDYIASSAFLYRALSGRQSGDPNKKPDDTEYCLFTIDQIKTSPSGETYIVDEWGNSIGYSTVYQRDGSGYNPTYDLWSTGGKKNSGDQSKWITNWSAQP